MEAITEQEIAAVSTAPRITPTAVEDEIASEHYFTAADGVIGENRVRAMSLVEQKAVDGPLSLLTICVLVLKNGFTVLGCSAPASPVNFNAGIGRRIAREDAVNKLWSYLGFRLRDQLTAAAPKTGG